METNIVHLCDNLEFLQSLPDASIDMVYCDPPFNTGMDWAGSGGYLDKFSDVIPYPKGFGWIDDCVDTVSHAYIAFMAHRILEIQRILKPTGHFFLHCDYRESGNLRVLGDYIFNVNRFRGEIIWHTPKTYPADPSLKISGFTVAHNNIFWWEAAPNAPFYPLYQPYSTKQIREFFHHKTPDGRRFRYKGRKGRVRLYADEQPGIPETTVWYLKVASPSQRSGYPTEKPLPLLHRIIQCSTKEGDIVLDPFCGSGVTLLAARNLNRQYIGVDVNEDAVLISQRRLGGIQSSQNGGQNGN